ncbi:YaiI/YqxD family protein [Oceanobacillus sp. CAU 1775]
MKIYIDADACPVKDIVIKEALSRDFEVVLVTSISHFSLQEYPAGVETIYVDNGKEAADYRIMALIRKGDLVITQDYGLASLALAKNCFVMHHKGFMYTNENIDEMLQSRYLSAQARKAGQRTKGPKAFTNEDKEIFRRKFVRVLEQG